MASLQYSPRASAFPARILLTGATGLLGRHVARSLSRRSATDLIILSRRPADVVSAATRVIEVPLTSPGIIEKVIEEVRPDAVIHCAATGLRNPKPECFETFHVNYNVTERLYRAAAAVPGSRFIYVSTGLVYHDMGRALHESDPLAPLRPYAASKAAADMLLSSAAVAYGYPTTIFRPFSFTGAFDDGGRLFPQILAAARNGTPLGLSSGEQVRDYCAVQDVAAAIEASLMRPQETPLEIFNVGSGQTVTLRHLIENVCRELDLRVDLRFGQLPPAANEPFFAAANITRASTVLGWKPRTNLAFAVWELAAMHAPELNLQRPLETI